MSPYSNLSYSFTNHCRIPFPQVFCDCFLLAWKACIILVLLQRVLEAGKWLYNLNSGWNKTCEQRTLSLSVFQNWKSPNFPTEDKLDLEAIMEHSFMCAQILLKCSQKWNSKIYHLNVNCLCRSASSLCGYGLWIRWEKHLVREKQVSFAPRFLL